MKHVIIIDEWIAERFYFVDRSCPLAAKSEDKFQFVERAKLLTVATVQAVWSANRVKTHSLEIE